VPDVTSRTFNFRHARVPPSKKKEEKEEREEKEREREREKVGGRYGAIGIAPSDCRRLRKCEVHVDSVFRSRDAL